MPRQKISTPRILTSMHIDVVLNREIEELIDQGRVKDRTTLIHTALNAYLHGGAEAKGGDNLPATEQLRARLVAEYCELHHIAVIDKIITDTSKIWDTDNGSQGIHRRSLAFLEKVEL